MGTKNVRKTNNYVTREKLFKSVKGLQRNFRKCILKNSQFFANISKLRPKQKTLNNRGSISLLIGKKTQIKFGIIIFLFVKILII